MKLYASGRVRCALAAILALGMFLLPAGISRAQSAVSFGESDTPGIIAKQKLTRVIETLQAVDAPWMDDVARDSLGEAQSLLNQMNSDELENLALEVGPQIDQMQQALAALEEIANPTEPPPPSVGTNGGFPNAPYPGYEDAITGSGTSDATENDCEGVGGCGDDTSHDDSNSVSLAFQWKCEASDGSPKEFRSTVAQAYASLIAFITAEAVRDIASRVCGQELGFLVAGGNVSVLCIPVDIIYIGAKAIYENIALCDSFIDAAEIVGTYHRLEHIHEDIGSHMTSLTNHDTAVTNALNTSATNLLNRTALAETNLTNSLNTHHTLMQAGMSTHDTAIKSDILTHDVEIKAALATHDTDIKTLLAEKRGFFLRLEIEEALARHERDAIYYLPEADGGQLSLVRTIVGETIASVAASGEPTNYANYYLYQADFNIASGNYKRAWDWLCDAYRKAVQIYGEVQP